MATMTTDRSPRKGAQMPTHREITVRIYAYPRGGRWYAEATDLALVAEGVEEGEAVKLLLEQIVAYVSTAIDRGWLDRLHRPASFLHRAEVTARVGLAKLRRQPAHVRTRRLGQLQAMIVEATGFDPFEIRQANVGEVITARPQPRRIFSSVEGVLRVLSGGDRTVWAGLREHGTNAYVRCRFDAATWRDRLGPLWEHRVIVEGMVAYNEDHKPRSIIDVKRVTPRVPGRALSGLAGLAPDLTGERSDDEFVAVIRGHG